jgi:hypothetical protein
MHAVPQQNLREAKNLVEVMPMTFLDRRRTFEQKATTSFLALNDLVFRTKLNDDEATKTIFNDSVCLSCRVGDSRFRRDGICATRGNISLPSTQRTRR